MEESSSEMSAEEMSEALSLEEKPEALSLSREKSREVCSIDHFETASLQGKPVEATCMEKKSIQADTRKEATEASAANQLEPNAEPMSKFKDKDPLDLVPYIEKYVTVQLERNYSYVGFVHSIDPMSHSIILSVPKEGGRYQTTLIPGTSILDITEAPNNSSIIPPKRKEIEGLLSPDVQLRKKKIISWLKDNRLPVSEEGENVVFGGITLLPPYGDKDICTTNPTIALEIKKIIGRMPADYQPK